MELILILQILMAGLPSFWFDFNYFFFKAAKNGHVNVVETLI
jgi:hypothetical protein